MRNNNYFILWDNFWQKSERDKLKLITAFVLTLIISITAIFSIYLISILIDNTFNQDEKFYGIYHQHKDFTGFAVDDNFYSTLTPLWHKADKTIRLIKYKNEYYQIKNNYQLEKDFSIVETNDTYYLKTTKIYKKISKLSAAMNEKISQNSIDNIKQLCFSLILFVLLIVILIYIITVLLSKQQIESLTPVAKFIALLTTIIALGKINLSLTFANFIVFVLCAIILWLYNLKIKEQYLKTTENTALIQNQFKEHFKGIAVIHSFNINNQMQQKFANSIANIKTHDYAACKTICIKTALINFILISAVIIILFSLNWKLSLGQNIIYCIYLFIIYNLCSSLNFAN